MRAPCPFCNYGGPSAILERGANSFVIEPINPVVPGHVLVVPYEHVADFATRLDLTVGVMRHATNYAQANLGECNLITSRGPAASQSVFHLHVHLVPRSPGDGLALPWTSSEAEKKLEICARFLYYEHVLEMGYDPSPTWEGETEGHREEWRKRARPLAELLP